MWLQHRNHAFILTALGNCRLLLWQSYLPSGMGWVESPGSCNSPHPRTDKDTSLSLTLFKILEAYMKATKSLSAYFSSCIKNVLARVKSDNSLKNQTSNNQKLREPVHGCWFLWEIPNILPSMDVELCTKVSTPQLLSSQTLADLTTSANIQCLLCITSFSYLPSQKFLDLPKLLQESLSISNTLTCYTSPQLACVLRETNTG